MIVPPAAAYWERRLSLQATIPGMRNLVAVDGGGFPGALAVAARTPLRRVTGLLAVLPLLWRCSMGSGLPTMFVPHWRASTHPSRIARRIVPGVFP